MTRLEIATALLASSLANNSEILQYAEGRVRAAFDLAEAILAEDRRRHQETWDAAHTEDRKKMARCPRWLHHVLSEGPCHVCGWAP